MPEKKTTRLKRLITSPALSFVLEAHNGLSARLVEEAGFPAIWASGFAIAASQGVRDCNETSWTQGLEVVELMADATTVPILVDGDTGHGNFNTMRRYVRKLEQRGAAGVCIEDKLFPKTNSYVRGTQQPLAGRDEFAGKIKAGKDAQSDPDFVIVARVEAFIAGWGLGEALDRAEAYRLAGADAVLIHSAQRTAAEVLAFKREWGDRLPVVIVPTAYYTTPTAVFREHGFSVVIWANQMMRACVVAMRETARQLAREENLLSVDDRIAPMADVFRLQGEDELAEQERLYLPGVARRARALILAASRGEELGSLTAVRPKCMVDIAGVPLLQRVADTYRAAGVRTLTVVRGFGREAVDLAGLEYVDNDEHGTTAEAWSLWLAREALQGECLVSYGDVLFKKYVVQELLETDDDFAVAVDAHWHDSRNRGRLADLVRCSAPRSRLAQPVYLRGFGDDEVHGEWMGFLKVSARGAAVLVALMQEAGEETLRRLKVPDLIARLLAAGEPVRVVYTSGHWLDVDSIEDVVLGASFSAT